MKGKDFSQQIGQKEYNDLWKVISLMLRMCIFVSGKAVVLDSIFCDTKYITDIQGKGLYAGSLIKKRCYLPKVVLGDLI